MYVKLIKNKFVIGFIVLLFVIIADYMLPNINLVDRAIVVGMGIDYVSEEEISMSVQYVIPKSNAANQSVQSGFAVATQSGIAIGEIMVKFQNMLGIYVSLAHSSIIVIGEEYAKKGNFEILKYLMINEKVPDTSKIVVSEGKASDFIRLNIPYSDIVSYQLRNLLGSLEETHGVTNFDINRFLQADKEGNTAKYIPYAIAEKFDKNNFQDSDVQSSDIEFFTCNIDNTAVFDNGGMKLVLTKEESNGLSYVIKTTKNGYITIKSDGNEILNVKLISIGSKININSSDLSAKIEVDAKVTVYESDKVTVKSSRLSEMEENRFKGVITKNIFDCYSVCKDSNIDIFGFSELFYKEDSKKWESINTLDLLSKLRLDIIVNVKYIN